MTADVRVSIIIPVYGAEKTLARALDSVFAQTHKNIECIVINDASPDKCGAILTEYAAKEPRLKNIFLERNSGTMSARRKGIEAASGKYLMFLDPDDEFTPDALERLVAIIEKESVDFVHFDTLEFKELPDGSYKQEWHWCPTRGGRIEGTENILRDLLRTHGHRWNLCLKIIRREVFQHALRRMEDFDCVMCEDLYADLAMELESKTMCKADFVPYRYYIGAGISSDKKRSLVSFRRLYSSLKALALCHDMLPDELKPDFYELQLKQCRILLSRAAYELTEIDASTAMAELPACGYCTKAMLEAKEMPLLASINSEDFLQGYPSLRKLMDALLPVGTRRRWYVKTFIKRI